MNKDAQGLIIKEKTPFWYGGRQIGKIIGFSRTLAFSGGARTIRYLILFFTLYGLYFFLLRSSWLGGEQLHILLEVISSFLAALVGIMTIVSYYTKKNSMFLFIGIGFLGASVLDAYHAFVSTHLFFQLFPHASGDLSSWSFLASRLFFSLCMFLSIWIWQKERKMNTEVVTETQTYLFSGALLLGSLFFISFVPLPKATFDTFFIRKPQEYMPALLFFFAFIGYFQKGRWKNDYFEHLLILSLIVGIVGQGLFMASSQSAYDIMFDTAHFMKIMSYMFVLIGLIISMYQLFKQAETGKDLVASQNLALKDTRREMEQALKRALENETELASKVRDLEDTKRALSNVISDLDIEKGKVEEVNVKDEAMLSSIGDGILVIDKEGKIVLVNTQAEMLLATKSSDLIEKKWEDVIQIQDEKEHIVPFERQPFSLALTTNQKHTSSCIFTRKDSTKFPASVTTSPVVLSGAAIGVIMVFRDITREKEVDRMKTEFISLASHQLRTPLSAIRWFSEMLLDGDAGKLTSEQKEFVDNIAQSTERMIELVNSLLNISRIESGRIIVDPKPTDLGELVKQVLNDLTDKFQTKKQKIIVSIHKNLPLINLDQKLIRQVYMNLLTNAIKYTPPGGEISVFISQKGPDVISQVSDNGYGVPKREQDKLFEKFFRAENIVKIETDGTGLGLYLVKAIIESSQGKIWFKSEEGHGTTFWFSIPLSGMTAKTGEVTLDS